MKYVIGLSFAALTIWAFQATGAFMAFAIFLMIGVIPGTSIVVPPSIVLTLLSFSAAILIYLMFHSERPKAQKISEQIEPIDAPNTIQAQNAHRTVTRIVLWRIYQRTLLRRQHAIRYMASKLRKATKHTKPYIVRFLTWLRKQIIYSVKGTMLSAHRWSSLSKKVWFSLATWLNRCNSALKRGKSLWTRLAR